MLQKAVLDTLQSQQLPVPPLVAGGARNDGGGFAASLSMPILATLPIQAGERVAMKLYEVLFEQLRAPAAYICNAQILGAYSAGRNTGVVVDVGYSGARIVPIYEGVVLREHARLFTHLGTQAQEDYLLKSHLAKYPAFAPYLASPWLLRAIASDIRQRFCFCCMNAQQYQLCLQKPDLEHWYRLPPLPTLQPLGTTVPDVVERVEVYGKVHLDGKDVTSQPLSMSNFQNNRLSSQAGANEGGVMLRSTVVASLGEYLFKPQELSATHEESMVGLCQAVKLVVDSCDSHIRRGLWGEQGAVILTGGGSMMLGLAARFKEEMKDLAKISMPVSVIAESKRHSSNWTGGAILAHLINTPGERKIGDVALQQLTNQLWNTQDEWEASKRNGHTDGVFQKKIESQMRV